MTSTSGASGGRAAHHVDKKVLTGPQLAVLRWIADDCPDGIYEGYSHRQSARALENRGLARVWGHGKTWRAELTDKGRAALDHLAFVSPQVESADLSSLDPSPVDLLLARLIAAGGVLDVGAEFTRDQLQQFARDALKSSARPHAQRLAYVATDGWVGKHFRLRLSPYFEDTVEASPVPVPEHLSKLHPLAKCLREDKEAGVSKEHLTRAVRIVHALATEAERRGMRVSHPSGHTDQSYNPPTARAGEIAIERGGDVVTLELRELPPNKGAARPYVWDHSWRGWDSKPRLVRNEKFISTGVLQLLVTSSRRFTQAAIYRDSRGRTVEGLLPLVLRDVELTHLYAEEARAAGARAATERKQEKQRLLERAKERFVQDARSKELDRQVADWQRAGLLRQFAGALDAADHSEPAAEWTTWIRAGGHARPDEAPGAIADHPGAGRRRGRALPRAQ